MDEQSQSRSPHPGSDGTITIETGPEFTKVLIKFVEFLEGTQVQALQKQVDELTARLVKSNTELQADLHPGQ